VPCPTFSKIAKETPVDVCTPVLRFEINAPTEAGRG
jgi:hypothetical protein